jgi:hypothetical protein
LIVIDQPESWECNGQARTIQVDDAQDFQHHLAHRPERQRRRDRDDHHREKERRGERARGGGCGEGPRQSPVAEATERPATRAAAAHEQRGRLHQPDQANPSHHLPVHAARRRRQRDREPLRPRAPQRQQAYPYPRAGRTNPCLQRRQTRLLSLGCFPVFRVALRSQPLSFSHLCGEMSFVVEGSARIGRSFSFLLSFAFPMKVNLISL